MAMWGVKLGMLLAGVLLAMVPATMQLTALDRPIHHIVKRINEENGPFLGLVLSNGRDEKVLKRSGYFVPDEATPYIIIAGRKFNFGKFKDTSAIYVTSGSPLTAIGVTVQILIDNFNIRGIINYGDAGTISNGVFIADVVVPAAVAYTSNWKWQKYQRPLDVSDDVPSLSFGDYNLPEAGENSLGSINFQTAKFYTPTSGKKETFWFPVHPEWVQLASSIKGVTLEGCAHADCRLGAAHVVHGTNAASSDIYLLNVDYAAFLNKKLNATIIDTESAAVVSTAIANGVPHIVIRGASDRPGLDYDKTLGELTSKNVLNVVAQFVERVTPTPYNILNAY